MGAEPLFALNVTAFPVAALSVAVMGEVLAGALEVAEEAGLPILGGHTIEASEPMFGWVVVGRTTEDRLWRNSGARPGDVLVLTKPLGNGIWATAAKHGLADLEGWEAVQAMMRRLNREAARVLTGYRPRAVTDVTGFGLLGHLREMLVASGADAELWAESLPVLAGTESLIARGEVPGGTVSNLASAARWTDWDDDVPEALRMVMADAQTSGGLLAAVPRDRASELLTAAEEADMEWALIGRVSHWGSGRVTVRSRADDSRK